MERTWTRQPAVYGAVLLSVLLRLRFVATPLTADEGGYVAIGRAVGAGRRLYSQAWIDRPQGIVWLFWAWERLTGGSTASVRVLGMIFGALAVVGAAYIAGVLGGKRAAGVAAVVAAVASASARIEGFVANGELLSSAIVAAGVAAACAYLVGGRGRRWLFASGVLAGLAVSIKQSGFDGFVALVVCIAAAAAVGRRDWSTTWRDLCALAAGLGSVLLVLAADGLVLGLDRWWYAIAGYRLGASSVLAHPQWANLRDSWHAAAPTVLPLAVVAAVVLVRRRPNWSALVPVWIVATVLFLLAGGQYHRHYWVTLAVPLAVGAGLVLSRLRLTWAALASAAVLLPSLAGTVRVIALHRDEIPTVASDDGRSVTDEQIAEWYEQHRTPTSTIYALCASAGLYADAGAVPPYAHLWFDDVRQARGAQVALEQMFASPDAPTFVAEYQTAETCNPGGRVAHLLSSRYTQVARIRGIAVLQLRVGAEGVEPPTPAL